MRLLLLASFASIDSDGSAHALRARGYEAVSFYELHMPDYHGNGGRTPSDLQARRNMGCELLENAVAVIHPETDLELLTEIQGVCKGLRVPMVRYADVPFTPSTSTEWVDAANCVNEPAHAILGLPAGAGQEKKVHYLMEQELIGTTSEMKVVHRAQPSHLDVLLAEDNNKYSGDFILRNLRSAFIGRISRMFSRVDRHLSGMKNPMVAQMQQGPRPYVMRTPPVSTTG